MSLDIEIGVARKKVVADGYEMSFGELMSLYSSNEIRISPAFQRLFRWDQSRKTRFIESLLLGIPIPPIFVFQDEDGVWELIDGLQRVSTVLEFAGLLRDDRGELCPSLILDGTRFLPSLANKAWSDEDNFESIGRPQQLQIKRARVRVEILQQESDPETKYELFQRLNTGGASLSEQEVRNSIAVRLNNRFFEWLKDRSTAGDFKRTISQTDAARSRQSEIELALRFFAFRRVPYPKGLDVNEYLDKALYELANPEKEFPYDDEAEAFKRTFHLLDESLGERAFKRWNGQDFAGKFLMSVYEVVAKGVSENVNEIEALPEQGREFIRSRCRELWEDEVFMKNNGAGVRGSTRLTHLLPMAADFFKP